MKHSATLTKIAPALHAAQAALRGALKDSNNPHFKSKFANLESVWDAVRAPLRDSGISVVQAPCFDNGEACLSTVLLHTSGEYVSGVYPLRPVKQDPQGFIAALTYARRSNLASMLGVIQVDDDGETASGRGDEAPAAPRAVVPTPTAPKPLLAGKVRSDVNDKLVAAFGDIEENFTAMCVAGGMLKAGQTMTMLSTIDAQRALGNVEAVRAKVWSFAHPSDNDGGAQ